MKPDNDVMTAESDNRALPGLGARSLVLIGMMGSGKSSIGRKLAQRLNLPFVDADTEIERAAGMSISDIFAKHGEPYFRAGEARVIARLLDGGPQVLATGGGAFMNLQSREAIRAKGISVWLKAEYEVLMKRLKRRNDRPMLKTDDPGETLRRLLKERDPVYAEADVTVHSRDVPHEVIISEIIAAVEPRLP
jgi:shikimate kinase